MSHGQLKLHYAAMAKYHGCDGTVALGHVHRVPEDFLRSRLVEYEKAAAAECWGTAEDALLDIAAKAIAGPSHSNGVRRSE